MRSVINIPKGMTHGEDLVVMRRADYETFNKRLAEYKDAFAKIQRGEKEFLNGKALAVKSLAELS